jgi:hypothetical protein
MANENNDNIPISQVGKNLLGSDDNTDNLPIDRLNPITVIPNQKEHNGEIESLPPLERNFHNANNREIVDDFSKKTKPPSTILEKTLVLLLILIVLLQIGYIVYKSIDAGDRFWSIFGLNQEKQINQEVVTYEETNTYDPLIVDMIYKYETDNYLLKIKGGFTYPDITTKTVLNSLYDYGLIPTLNINDILISKGDLYVIGVGDVSWLFDDGKIIAVSEANNSYVEIQEDSPIYSEINKVGDIMSGDLSDWFINTPFGYIFNNLKQGKLELNKTSEEGVFSGFYTVNNDSISYTQPISFTIDPQTKLMTKISLFNEKLNEWEVLEIETSTYETEFGFEDMKDSLESLNEKLSIEMNTLTDYENNLPE